MISPTLELSLRVSLERFELALDWTTAGRVVGVFGPSGSGKTTLLETVAGLRGGARGCLRVGGETWFDESRGICLPPERRGVGYVPQDHLLFPHRSVAGNLAVGARRARAQGQDVGRIRREVIEVLELEPLLPRPVETLSGGERQRVALGRALCSGPRLLMLDEPLASLDLALRRKILPFLRRVREHFEIPMLVVSHHPAELLALCDEVLAIRAGAVVASGAPVEVLARAEVYAAAASEGFENMLPGRVQAQEAHRTLVELGRESAGPMVSVPRVEAPVGERVLLGLPAHDILVAIQPVDGLSARNRLRARLTGIEPSGHRQVLTARLLDVDLPPLAIELTAEAVEDLALAPGSPVWLLVKSSAIAVYT
ncbi:MAG: molybdenum ABC transporter ATP-binding protein [Opitutales bacterium]